MEPRTRAGRVDGNQGSGPGEGGDDPFADAFEDEDFAGDDPLPDDVLEGADANAGTDAHEARVAVLPTAPDGLAPATPSVTPTDTRDDDARA